MDDATKYVHTFDLCFDVETFDPNPDQVGDDELMAALLARISNLLNSKTHEGSPLGEAIGCFDTTTD